MSSDDGVGKEPPSSGLTSEHDRQDHQNSGRSTEGSRKGSAPTVAIHDNAIAGDDSQRQTSEHASGRKGEQHQPTLSGAGRAVTVANAVLAAVGIGTLVVTMFQLNSMDRQLEQMKVANKNAVDAIEVATRQANAAESANKIASEALSSADRAWVYALIEPTEDPAENKAFRATIRTHNGGRTPAINLRTNITIQTLPFGSSPVYNDPPADGVSTVLFPNTQFPIVAAFRSEQMTEQMVQNIGSGMLVLYIAGSIKYEDINKNDHRTVFCSYYKVSEKMFTPCASKGANSAD